MDAGIDPRNQLIPIAPAVHYHMGGIATDSYGQTNLNGLLAVGECSAVGVHGANRLASNSLLEAIVFGDRAARYINGKNWENKLSQKIKTQPWLSMGKEVSHSLRKAMTLNCGVQRNDKKLNILINHINYLIEKVGPANPLVASKMIASCALAREECRGAHYRDDFNFTKKNAKSSYITYDMLD